MRRPHHPGHDLFSEHEIGRELKAMSARLDAHREVIALVTAELCRPGLMPTGRDGLPAESVLRCALLKQYRQLSYQELAFHLSDSASFRAFARLPLHWCPKKSVLQETISAISARTWERINRCLLASASETKVETGTLLRLDSTVTETMIHEPSDSWLLCDAMRIMVRLLDAAGDLPQAPAIAWHNHSRRAKRRAQAIDHYAVSRPDRRRRLDRGLSACRRGQGERRRVCRGRGLACLGGLLAPLGRAGYRADRAARPPVPAAEKLVSLFEPHTSSSRAAATCTTATSSTYLGQERDDPHVVIEAGNPDAERLLPMLERHRYLRPATPTDGRRAMPAAATSPRKRASGMAFHKKRGLKIEDMVRSRWGKLRKPASRPASRARLWLGALHLEGPGPLQGLRLAVVAYNCTPQAGARLTTARDTRPGGARRLTMSGSCPEPTATTTYYMSGKSRHLATRRLWPAQDPGKTPRLWTDTS